MASDGTKKDIVLIKAAEEKCVAVLKVVAMQSPALKKTVESGEYKGDGFFINIPRITGIVFSRVFDYCWAHLNDGVDNSVEYKNKIADYDKKFVDLDVKSLYDIMEAAHILELHTLFDLVYEKASTFMKGESSKGPAEVTMKEDDPKPEKANEALKGKKKI